MYHFHVLLEPLYRLVFFYVNQIINNWKLLTILISNKLNKKLTHMYRQMYHCCIIHELKYTLWKKYHVSFNSRLSLIFSSEQKVVNFKLAQQRFFSIKIFKDVRDKMHPLTNVAIDKPLSSTLWQWNSLNKLIQIWQ